MSLNDTFLEDINLKILKATILHQLKQTVIRVSYTPSGIPVLRGIIIISTDINFTIVWINIGDHRYTCREGFFYYVSKLIGDIRAI